MGILFDRNYRRRRAVAYAARKECGCQWSLLTSTWSCLRADSDSRWSWSTFGETAIMCWPFQYLMSWSACSVDTMSSVLIDDISDSCLIEMAPLCD